MKTAMVLLVALSLLSTPSFADGTVSAPVSVSLTSWKIANISIVTGAHATDPPGITITIYYFDSNGAVVPGQTSTVLIASADVASFLTAIGSPVAGESGSSIKRFRQRASAWLIANGKITNVTPE